MISRRLASRAALALLSISLLAACAGQQTTRTGFLADDGPGSALTGATEDPTTLRFAASAASFTGFASVLIEPVVFRPGPAVPAERDQAVLRGLSAAYADALADAFSRRGYAVVSAPDGRTLRVRAAITGYERANVGLNVVSSLVIGPVTAGGAASEAEVLDAGTGERFAALATHSNGTPFLGGPINYYLEHGHARAALRRHATALAAEVPDRGASLADAR
jgi:hypothetical protein